MLPDRICCRLQAAQQQEDKRQAVADEMAARDAFFCFWCGHLRKTLGLVKKLETRRRGAPNSSGTVIGGEVSFVQS